MLPSTHRRDRRHFGDSREDQRSNFQRDRDRILYTTSLRRLGAITQVMAPSERPIIHNRLTHSLEVAQIGRRLAEKLIVDNEIDPEQAANEILSPDVVEAACLAHDLGHPPFGHVTEDELNDLAYRKDVPEGFNGNAQSFRIVTKLATRHESFHGLNLTAATLNAILKYPWLKANAGSGRTKWGAYESERDDFDFARGLPGVQGSSRSVEAEIMDWADDVAFAAHDLDDFFRAGIIPLDRLRADLTENGPAKGGEIDRFLTSSLKRVSGKVTYSDDELRQAFLGILANFPMMEPYQGSFRHRAIVGSYTSHLIKRYIYAITLEATPNGDSYIRRDPHMDAEVVMLKQLTWEYVIDNPRLATQQYGQRKLIRELFTMLVEAARDTKQWYIFPPAYHERLSSMNREGTESNYHGLVEVWDHEGEGRIRMVIDMISSLTEQQTVELHGRLSGISLGSALETII